MSNLSSELDKQYTRTYNVTLRSVRVKTVAMEK